jgi:hypothetical protein
MFHPASAIRFFLSSRAVWKEMKAAGGSKGGSAGKRSGAHVFDSRGDDDAAFKALPSYRLAHGA